MTQPSVNVVLSLTCAAGTGGYAIVEMTRAVRADSVPFPNVDRTMHVFLAFAMVLGVIGTHSW